MQKQAMGDGEREEQVADGDGDDTDVLQQDLDPVLLEDARQLLRGCVEQHRGVERLREDVLALHQREEGVRDDVDVLHVARVERRRGRELGVQGWRGVADAVASQDLE